MKKKIMIVLGIVLMLVVVLSIIAVKTFGEFGSRPDGTTDTMELGEVRGLVIEKGYTQEEIEEKLKGEYRENILVSWGEPDGKLSGFWGEVWFLDEEKDKKITLYYDADGCVENVRIGSRSKEMVDAILSDIDKEGIVSARFDSNNPNYMYDVEDLTIIDGLLDTLDGATYEACVRPEEPWSSIEAIYITTKENEYYLGVIENSVFRISVNGEGEYYTCSNKDDFQGKLLELQGR